MNSSGPQTGSFRTFLVVWLMQSLSGLGSIVSYFAITIWLAQVAYAAPEQEPELALALSGMTLAFFTPGVLVTPFAGAWADRTDRKRMMVVTNSLNFVVSILLMALMTTGFQSLWMMFVLMALSGLLESFHTSAFQASYVMIVPEKHLTRANGMMQTTASLSNIVGPGLAASVIALPAFLGHPLFHFYQNEVSHVMDGVVLCIGVDALTFLLAAISLLFLVIPSPKNLTKKKQTVWKETGEGMRFLWSRKPLLWLLATFTVGNFVLPFMFVLQPLLMKYHYQVDWTRHGFTYTTAFALLSMLGNVGGVVGGLVVSTWGGLRVHKAYGVFVPAIVTAMGITAFGLTQSYYLAIACNFIILATMPITAAHFQSILQTETPHNMQGRVLAIRRLLGTGLFPLGTACAGLLGTTISLSVIIVVLGSVFALFNIAQLFNPMFFPKNIVKSASTRSAEM